MAQEDDNENEAASEVGYIDSEWFVVLLTCLLRQGQKVSVHSSQYYRVVLWSTQRLSTFMSTQRISQHVDMIFNISTKEQWKNKMSIIT